MRRFTLALSALTLLGTFVAFAGPAPIGTVTTAPGGAPPTPIATTSTAGKVKPDGTTITVQPDGTISAAAAPPVASATVSGTVKIGSGLSMDGDGKLNNTGVAGVASFGTPPRAGAVKPGFNDYSASMIKGLAAVAKSGAYSDLTGKPTIPAAQVQADWTQSNPAAVDFVKGKPTVPTALSQLSQSPGYRTVTDTEKAKWDSQSNAVTKVNDKTGDVVLTATDVGADPLGAATSVQENLDAHDTSFRNYTSTYSSRLAGDYSGRTLKADDLITKGPWVDLRSLMDGQSGRPTLAAWQADQAGTDLTLVFVVAAASGKPVSLPPGVLITDQVTLQNNLYFRGAGKGITTIRRKAGSVNSLLFYSGDGTHRLRNFRLENLTLDGVDSTVGGAGVYVNYFGRAYTGGGETLSQSVNIVSGCEIKNFSYGGYVQWGDQFYFTDCDIHHNGKGVYANNSANLVNISNSAVHHNTNEGVLIANVSSNCTIFGSYINDNGGYGVKVYVAEQPSIIYCAFNRNGLVGNLNAIYLEGYANESNTYLTEAVTIEGCLFGANSGNAYDIGMTYVEGVSLKNNYFYNVTEGKSAFIRLFTHSLGVTVEGSRWKASPGVTVPPKVSAVADAVYTLNDSGDTAHPEVALVEPGSSTSAYAGLGVITPPVAATVSNGVVDLTALRAEFIRIPVLTQNVTSIVFPAAPKDGQRLTLRFKQAAAGGPYTVAGWPSNVAFTAGTFIKAAAANSQDVISFVYVSGQAEWLEVGRSGPAVTDSTSTTSSTTAASATAVKAAYDLAASHSSRHATGQPDAITPASIGALTPSGDGAGLKGVAAVIDLVKDAGAVADSNGTHLNGTDNHDVIVNAMTLAIASGKTLHIPPGIFRTSVISKGVSDGKKLTISGSGTLFIDDDTTSVGLSVWGNGKASTSGSFEMSGITFTRYNTGVQRTGAYILSTWGLRDVKLRNNELSGSAYATLMVNACVKATVTGNQIHDGIRDGIDFGLTDNTVVTGNQVWNTGDDGIAIAGNGEVGQLTTQSVVANNVLWNIGSSLNGGACIKVTTNISNVLIADNTMKGCYAGGVSAANFTTAYGGTSKVDIKNNTIDGTQLTDSFYSSGAGIVVGNQNNSYSMDTFNISGNTLHGTGIAVGSDSGGYAGQIKNISISGNKIYNPNFNGIRADYVQHLTVTNNEIYGASRRGLSFSNVSSSFVLTNNKVYDYARGGGSYNGVYTTATPDKFWSILNSVTKVLSSAAAEFANSVTPMVNLFNTTGSGNALLGTANGGTGVSDMTFSGNTHKVATVSGTLTVGKQATFDANGNVIASSYDAGATGGDGSGTVSSGTAGQFAYYQNDGTAVTGKTLAVGDISGAQASLSNSAGLASAISDETGTGKVVFNTSPEFNGTAAVAHTVGSNIVTNGTFNTDLTGWSTVGGWVQSSGAAWHTAGSGAAALNQVAATATVGVLYKLTFDISGMTVGTVQPNFGGIAGPLYSASGTSITWYATPTSTAALGFSPSTTFDGSIDNIVLTPLSGGALNVGDNFHALNTGWTGIGTAAPSSPIELFGNGASASFTSTTYSGGDNINFAPGIVGRGSRGTVTSPIASKTGDGLFVLGARGNDGTAFSAFAKGIIGIYAGENWTSSTQGTYVAIHTTANGGTTRNEKMRIHPSGGVSIGNTADPGAGNLSVSGTFIAGYTALTDTSATISTDTTRLTVTSTTARTLTLPKTLPVGTSTANLTVVASGAAASVTFAAETGGSISWGDAGAPATTGTVASGKRQRFTCVSENPAATTTAAWDCYQAGGTF